MRVGSRASTSGPSRGGSWMVGVRKERENTNLMDHLHFQDTILSSSIPTHFCFLIPNGPLLPELPDYNTRPLPKTPTWGWPSNSKHTPQMIVPTSDTCCITDRVPLTYIDIREEHEIAFSQSIKLFVTLLRSAVRLSYSVPATSSLRHSLSLPLLLISTVSPCL
ncbi:hypothetical protein QCA50_013455 [Cerrena zonata]|uniref:Uncharacterized protein n=1 Tax=Cerrena zonata TaxID=2478898 RepID=A0AAW0FU23_9APHY